MKPYIKQLINILSLSAIILLAPSIQSANALEVSGQPVPESDIQLLPPVCKLILIEMPGIHYGGGGAVTKYAYLLDKPEYNMAKNNPHIHHYCWSLVNRMRYFRSQTANERNYWFSRIMDDSGYVLRNSPKDWPYFHVILLEQGLMMMLQGDYKGSLSKAKEALQYRPGEEKAYALEFDAYMEMKERDKAISAAQEGLVKNPTSKILRRRLEQLGIKTPPPTQTTEKVDAPAEANHAEGQKRINSQAADGNPAK